MPDTVNINGRIIRDAILRFRPSDSLSEGEDLILELTFNTTEAASALQESDFANFELAFEDFTPSESDPVFTGNIEAVDSETNNYRLQWRINSLRPVGPYKVIINFRGTPTPEIAQPPVTRVISALFTIESEPTVKVSLQQTATPATLDIALWIQILKGTEALSFKNYNRFLDVFLCGNDSNSFPIEREFIERFGRRRRLPFNDTDAYRFLKVATEAFVMANCAVLLDTTPEGNRPFRTFDSDDYFELVKRLSSLVLGPQNHTELQDRFWRRYLVAINGTEQTTLPYLSLVYQKLSDLSLKQREIGQLIETLENGSSISNSTATVERCVGIIGEKLTSPCFMELIWSYWMEEGMLVQSLNAICRRFQNVRGSAKNDPLANMEIAPLRLINNLLWGYIQDEQHRLSVRRRAYEYSHQYGISLQGDAIPNLQPADSRVRFLEAFHKLLSLTSEFYKQADDTTVIEDGFPILNAIKEVHLVLGEGAHNQFGNVETTARIEMMMQQWILSRPEFREFLPTRTMVAYPEPWMDRVAAMNTLQGWTDASLIHFLNLAVFGEQLLLSIRFGAWSEINDRQHATNWANFWREQIQGYIYAYRGVTGVDLSATRTTGSIDAMQPSYHLAKRLQSRQNGKMPSPSQNGVTPNRKMVKKS